jgi:uncharacterized membrane protein
MQNFYWKAEFLQRYKIHLLLVLIAIAAILRIPLLTDDLWFDEILSFNLSKTLGSFWGIFRDTKVDNNHILNTTWLYLVGSSDSWLLYRFASLISGLISVFLIFKICEIFGRQQAITAALISAVSFPLVLYSSEARGYALSFMFALFALQSLQYFVTKNSKIHLFLFWTSCILAMLSHFSFSYIYGAYLQWSIFVLWKKRLGKEDFLIKSTLLHIIPATTFALLYFYFIQDMTIVGSNIDSWWNEIGKFTGFFYGQSHLSITTTLLFIFSSAIVIIASYILYKKNSYFWPLPVLAIFLNPFLVIMISGYEFPQMRFFLILSPFLIFALSTFLVDFYQRYKAGKYFYWLFLTFYTFTNFHLYISFYENGRGEYLSAVEYMARNSAAKNVSIGSDHDYRNYTILEYYAKFLPRDMTISYISSEVLGNIVPMWYIVHDFSRSPDPATQISIAKQKYQLKESFLASYPNLIGWNWHIYRKTN